jgi:hypothetical protein
VRLPLGKGRSRPAKPAFIPDDILVRANALFGAEQSQDLQGVIAEKIEELQHYDVLAMERVAAISMWGRSGSLLVASYLDGHADVLMLPEMCSERLYEFFERYQGLTLRDKLIAFAAFEPDYPRLFEGDFAISPAQYQAAVQAIVEFYGKWPPEFLASRRAFFLFVHIAYNLALGRRPASPCPLIVHMQHVRDDALARYLTEDFPQAKFVHTVRDPISSCNGLFHYLFGALAERFPRTYIRAPYTALDCLANKDRPHAGMESRTRTIRFEDLHRDPAETMRDLADWLGLPYQATLLDSTFNGIPWVVKRDGKAWSGQSLEQVRRQSGDLSRKDQALLFALFYDNFIDWNYPCPRIFRHATVRCIVFVSLVLFPMKMEILAARAIFERSILPSLRHGKISAAIKSLLGVGFCRLRIFGLLALAFSRRCVCGTTLLQVDHKGRSPEWREDGLRVASNETKLR